MGDLKTTEQSYGHGLLLGKSELGLAPLYLSLPVPFLHKNKCSGFF